MTGANRWFDTAVVLVLVAIALLGLDGSYATRGYLVLGLSSALVSALLVLSATSAGRGAEMVLPGWVLLYPLVGAMPALLAASFAPDSVIGALGDVLGNTFTAPATLLGTIPPVDPSPDTLMLPHALGFFGAGAAVWIALRSRRPVAPLLPLIVVEAAVILLGVPSPTQVLLRGICFAAVGTWWVSVRGKRTTGIEHARRGLLVRAVGGLALVGLAAGVVAYVAPAAAQSRVVLRGRLGTGQDVSQLDNPLATFRKFTPQPEGTPDNVADKRLLRVTGLARGSRLRFVTLDVYRDQGWRADNRTVPGDATDLYQKIGSLVSVARPGRTVDVDVQVRAYRSSWLPLPGQLRSISFDFLDGDAQRSDVRYDPATTTAMVVGGLSTKDDYSVRAVVPDLSLTRSMASYPTRAPLQPEGAFLDRYLDPWTRSSTLSPLGRVYSLATYLRKNGRYSDGATPSELVYRPGNDPGRLGEGFIGAPAIVGDDEQYASFMALAANRFGVPARVVVGAVPGKNGWVLGRNVEAWVEIRVSDGSWRVLPTSRFMSTKKPTGADRPQSPQAYVDAETPQPDDPATTPPDGPKQQKDETGTRTTVASRTLLPFLGLLVLAVVASPAAAKLVRARRRRAARRTSRAVAGAWQELVDLAHDAGIPVAPGSRRREQALALGVDPGLAERADRLVFAVEPPTAQEVADYWRDTGRARRDLRGGLSLVRRVRAVLSPVSLLRRTPERQSRLRPRLSRADA